MTFVGSIEQVEATMSGASGRLEVVLRHRDDNGRRFEVRLEVVHLETHGVSTIRGVRGKSLVISFPPVPLAAFVQGDTLHICPREALASLATRSNDPSAPSLPTARLF
jgi:hypothetical protein